MGQILRTGPGLTTSNIINVFHGTRFWTPTGPIRARAIEYCMARGKTSEDSLAYAQVLWDHCSNFADLTVLAMAMMHAQESGLSSPFVSTSRSRHVARSFALQGGTAGFIVSIIGPEDAFYDFNAIRQAHHVPHPPQYRWLEELGIPFEVASPFEVVRVDKVNGVDEQQDCVYEKLTI